MEAVAPLGIQSEAAEILGPDKTRIIQVAFRNHVNPTVQADCLFPHCVAQLFQKRVGRVIEDAVDGVEAQSVNMKLPDPIKRVLDKERPYFVALWTIEVDRGSPRWFPSGPRWL